MKIAIVGPSHPYKGGIVQHTTELVHRLTVQGHEVELVSWVSQFPNKLYPGELLPLDQPEQAIFPNTTHTLNWYDPLSWRRAGKHLRSFDLVVFVWWVPTIQGPIYSEIAKHLKGVRKAAICHNVLPHEGRPGDAFLTERFFKKLDYLVVHTDEQASIAKQLTQCDIFVTLLPPLLPGWSESVSHHDDIIRKQLLFFGLVRDYKGLDVLLTALALVPDVKLTIAGEFWGGSHEYEQMIRKLDLASRVTIRSGYIPSEDIPQLFHEADALVLPYRSATGTTNVRLGFAYHVPVISSDVRALADQIRDGQDGLVFKTGDAKDLARSITQLYEKGALIRLRNNLPAIPVEAGWQTYINALILQS